MPERIRMTRQKPWRHLHPDAIVVDRRSKWGNPFRPVRQSDGMWVPFDENGVDYPGYGPFRTRAAALRDCVRLFIELGVDYELAGFTRDEVRAELRGHDLSCWCPLDQPCHADVLLELANA